VDYIHVIGGFVGGEELAAIAASAAAVSNAGLFCTTVCGLFSSMVVCKFFDMSVLDAKSCTVLWKTFTACFGGIFLHLIVVWLSTVLHIGHSAALMSAAETSSSQTKQEVTPS